MTWAGRGGGHPPNRHAGLPGLASPCHRESTSDSIHTTAPGGMDNGVIRRFVLSIGSVSSLLVLMASSVYADSPLPEASSEAEPGGVAERILTVSELTSLAAEFPGTEFNPDAPLIPLTAAEARRQLEMPTALASAVSGGYTNSEIAVRSLPLVPQTNGAFKIYGACHSYRHWLYGEIRHDAYLMLDEQFNAFRSLVEPAVRLHRRNLPGTDLVFVQHSQWDHSIDHRSGWLFGVSGSLRIYMGVWGHHEPISATCNVSA